MFFILEVWAKVLVLFQSYVVWKSNVSERISDVESINAQLTESKVLS